MSTMTPLRAVSACHAAGRSREPAARTSAGRRGRTSRGGLEMNALHASQRHAAWAAGVAYLFMVLGGILYWVLVGSRFTVAGAAVAAADAVMANERLFRIGIGWEIVNAVNLVVLALAHRVMLERESRNLASLGLHLVLAEAFLAAAMALAGFIALQLLNAQSSLTALGPALLHDLVGLYLDVRIAGHTVSAVFLNAGMIVFMWLLFRAGYVPRALAGFGMLSYLLMLALTLGNVLAPGAPASPMTLQSTFDVACVVPSILFEFTAGAWLLIKGLDLREGTLGTAVSAPGPGARP